MPDFRRYFVPGGTYFFTVVTDGRIPLFAGEDARTLLGTVLRACQGRWPFRIDALVLLPDHLHTIWTLPENDFEYPTRWGWIKKEFTKNWLACGGRERGVSTGRAADGRRGVWQPKYWEHTVRDEDDFERHMDYIHYNPVKHGYVRWPREWEWSSFHRWSKEGVYPADWGAGDMIDRFTPIAATVGE